MNTASPVVELKPSTAQAPRLLDQVVTSAGENGHAHDTAKQHGGLVSAI